MRRPGVAWTVAALAVASVLAVPSAVVLASLARPAREVWVHLWRTQLLEVLGNTLALVAGVGAGTLRRRRRLLVYRFRAAPNGAILLSRSGVRDRFRVPAFDFIIRADALGGVGREGLPDSSGHVVLVMTPVFTRMFTSAHRVPQVAATPTARSWRRGSPRSGRSRRWRAPGGGVSLA
jgi:hypothetical protein